MQDHFPISAFFFLVVLVWQGQGPEKKQASLCSDTVTEGRGWHNREIKFKESKPKEGHVSLGIK
jgi:hypothetical protein